MAESRLLSVYAKHIAIQNNIGHTLALIEKCEEVVEKQKTFFGRNPDLARNHISKENIARLLENCHTLDQFILRLQMKIERLVFLSQYIQRNLLLQQYTL